MSGFGRLITVNFYYEGQILNGKAQGFGKYEDKAIYYEGLWKEDKRNGKGE